MKLNINLKIKDIILLSKAVLILLILPCGINFAFPTSGYAQSFDQREYNAPDIGDSSILRRSFDRNPEDSPLDRPSQLSRPYRGLSGLAERSLTRCMRSKKEFLEQNSFPTVSNGRAINFTLKAKNKRYAVAGFGQPGATCVKISNERYSERIYGFIFAVYRGGISIEFPDINKMVVGSAGQTTRHELGDVNLRDIRMRNVNISLTVTDPPSMQIEIFKRHEHK